MNRPTFDQIWMELALSLSRRSTCSRAKVGCVVVSSDNQRVLSLGYNGREKGGPNHCARTEVGNCGCLHSEINALLKLNFNDAASRKLYTTCLPCEACAIAAVNSEISEVIYLRDYRKKEGLKILQRRRVKVWQMEERDLSLGKVWRQS